MGRFRIRLKLQGFELEVDGEREDIPAITAAVQHELSGLVQGAEVITDGQKQLEGGSSQVIDAELKKGRTARRRNGTPKSSGDNPASQPIEFRHDSAKYGNPLQNWSVSQKCIWLLCVIKGLTETKEVSGPQLAATFNQYFKGAGKVHPPHVTRDLGKAKLQNPAPIGEDKGLWYLTDEGDRQAQDLINGVLTPTA